MTFDFVTFDWFIWLLLLLHAMEHIKSFWKWFYRGEGNKSIVISNPSTRKVLRLRKVPTQTKNDAKQTNEWTQINIKAPSIFPSNMREELTRNIDFCRDIFVPLLGEKYVHPGTLVDLPRDFVIGIKHLVTSENRDRPRHRLTKEVRADCGWGVLFPDACFVSECSQNSHPETRPTFSVEIKPKLGTLPYCDTKCSKCDEQSSAYHKARQSVCKYCLLQWEKVYKDGKYPRRSGYCPLDLFSNNTRRVLYALMCLLKDPQNNLRIFKDGTLVYSGETNVPLNNSSQFDSAVPYVDPAPSANDPVPNHNGTLLDLEDTLRSSFIASHRTVTSGNLFGQGDDTVPLDQCTMLIVTLLQLLVDDSNNGRTVDDDVLIPNPPVCAESRYNDSVSFMNDIFQSHLDSSCISFGKSGILNKIVEVQKLDKLGSDEVFKIYEDISNNAKLNDNILRSSKFTLEHPATDGVDGGTVTKQVTLKYFEDESVHQSIFGMQNLTVSKSSPTGVGDELCIASKLNDIVKFLIAATANDCSIMISFQQIDDVPTSSTSYILEAVTGVYFKYSIAVVDLDPKNLSRIPKYHSEYHEIIKNYLHFSSKG